MRYFTQWEADTIGTNATGWTAHGSFNVFPPAYGKPGEVAVKRRFLSYTPPASGLNGRLISWDAIDGDAGRAKFDLLTCFPYDLATVEELKMVGRGAGSSLTDGYLLRLVKATGSLNIDKMVGSVYTSGLGSASKTLASGKSYFMRFNGDGAALKARLWDAALGMAGEPTAWDISITDASISAAGYVGLTGKHATVGTAVAPFNFFAVGTNGDAAVLPMTNADWADYVAKGGELVVTATLSAVGYNSAASPYTKTVKAFMSDRGYISHAQDTPSLKRFEACIEQLPTFSRQLGAEFIGPSTVGLGSMRVANPLERRGQESFTAVDLNGSTNYITATSSASLNFGAGSFSVLMRGRFDDFTYPKTFPSFGKPGTTWNTTAGWGVGATYSATSVFVFFNDGTNHVQGYIALDAGSRPTDLVGQFVELILIVNRTTNVVRLMVNGILQSGSLSISALTGSVSNSNQFNFGQSVGWYHDGLLDELRMWSRALSVTEGVAIYKRRLVDTSANLVLVWPCSEGTGSSVADKSGNGNTGTINGTATWATGTRTLVGNEDIAGRRDNLLRMAWNRSLVEIRVGPPSRPYHDHRPLLVGRVGQPTAPDDEGMVFELADLADAFQKPLITDVFTSGDYVGQFKPVLVGNPAVVEPPKTDTATLEWTVSTGTWAQGNEVVIDDGKEIWTDSLTVSAVNTGTGEITASALHGMVNGWRVKFSGGTPPLGIPLNTDRWVVGTTPGTDKFKLSATQGGAAITGGAGTTGAGFQGFGWNVNNGTGKLTLVGANAGRIMVMGPSSQANGADCSTADCYATIAFTLGGLSLNHKDVGSFDNLRTAELNDGSYLQGFWFGPTKTLVGEAMRAVAEGTVSWFGFSLDGLLQVGRVALPAATAVKAFKNVSGRGVRLVDVRRAVDYSKTPCSYAPWLVNGGPVAGAAALTNGLNQQAAQLKQYLGPYSYGASSTPLDNFPANRDADQAASVDLATGNSAVAEIIRTRLADLYKRPLGLFEFEAPLSALWHENGPLSLGDTVSLECDRLGWRLYTPADPASPDNATVTEARLAVVHGFDVNMAAPPDRQVTLKVFRPLIGFYPTQDVN